MIVNHGINYFNERFLMFVLDQMAYDYEKEGKYIEIAATIESLNDSELDIYVKSVSDEELSKVAFFDIHLVIYLFWIYIEY